MGPLEPLQCQPFARILRINNTKQYIAILMCKILAKGTTQNDMNRAKILTLCCLKTISNYSLPIHIPIGCFQTLLSLLKILCSILYGLSSFLNKHYQKSAPKNLKKKFLFFL